MLHIGISTTAAFDLWDGNQKKSSSVVQMVLNGDPLLTVPVEPSPVVSASELVLSVSDAAVLCDAVVVYAHKGSDQRVS